MMRSQTSWKRSIITRWRAPFMTSNRPLRTPCAMPRPPIPWGPVSTGSVGHGLLLVDDEALMPKLLSRVSSGQHPTGWAA